LLLEELYFWGEWFGKDNKGKSTKYKTCLDDVANHVKMPQKAMFFKDRSKKAAEEKKSSDSQSKKPEPEPTSDKRRPSLTVGADKKKEEHKSSTTTSRTPDAGSSKPSTKKMGLFLLLELSLIVLFSSGFAGTEWTKGFYDGSLDW